VNTAGLRRATLFDAGCVVGLGRFSFPATLVKGNPRSRRCRAEVKPNDHQEQGWSVPVSRVDPARPPVKALSKSTTGKGDAGPANSWQTDLQTGEEHPGNLGRRATDRLRSERPEHRGQAQRNRKRGSRGWWALLRRPRRTGLSKPRQRNPLRPRNSHHDVVGQFLNRR